MRFIACVLLVLMPSLALAWPANTTKEELALLPPWCAYTQQSWGSQTEPKAYAEYLRRYGPGWAHMHHYCYGLVSVNRLQRLATPKGVQPSVINIAKSEINYVLERTEKSFPFRAEILLNLVRLQIREGSLGNAEATARALVSDWPAFADGHAVLAEVLLRAGRKSAAEEVLRAGEELVSDKERYMRLKSILPNR